MAKKPKLLWVAAGDLQAGSQLVVQEGRIKKFYHVCEVGITGDKVMFVYNGPRGFEREDCEPDDLIQIRIDR